MRVLKICVPVLFLFISCAQLGFSADFSFVYTYGCANVTTVDTEKGILTNGGGTTKFQIAKKDMEEIRNKVNEIDFWHYPEDLEAPPDAGGLSWITKPSSTVHLKVVDGRMARELHFISYFVGASYYPPAVKLGELLNLIFKAINSSPDAKRIPRYNGPLCL